MCRGTGYPAPFFMRAYVLRDGQLVPQEPAKAADGTEAPRLNLPPNFFWPLPDDKPPVEAAFPSISVPSIVTPEAPTLPAEPTPLGAISPSSDAECPSVVSFAASEVSAADGVVPPISLTIEVGDGTGARKRRRGSLTESLLSFVQQSGSRSPSGLSLPPSLPCTPHEGQAVEDGYPFPVRKRLTPSGLPEDLANRLKTSPPSSPCPSIRSCSSNVSRAGCSPSAPWRPLGPFPRASPLPAPAYAFPEAD